MAVRVSMARLISMIMPAPRAMRTLIGLISYILSRAMYGGWLMAVGRDVPLEEKDDRDPQRRRHPETSLDVLG
jgi:hypothetical protein